MHMLNCGAIESVSGAPNWEVYPVGSTDDGECEFVAPAKPG